MSTTRSPCPCSASHHARVDGSGVFAICQAAGEFDHLQRAGLAVKLTCLGAPLLAHYPLSVIFDGFALNITVVSYRDGLDIGIVGDAETLPDAWDLLSDIRSELADLAELVATERSSD